MTNKYKLHIPDVEKQIFERWNDGGKNDTTQIIQDYLDMCNEICEYLFDDIEYCWFYANSLVIPAGTENYQICEISEDGKESLLSLDDLNIKLGKVKIFIDDSYMRDKTKDKDYICKVFDSETRTKLICEKIHLGSLIALMDENEAQEFTDGKLVFDLPLKLLIALDGKPGGYGNKFSDYNMKRKNNNNINILFK